MESDSHQEVSRDYQDFNQFSFDAKQIKEIGSLAGLNKDPNSYAYLGLREQESNNIEVRSIPYSREDEISNSQQQKRSINKERFDSNIFEHVPMRGSEITLKSGGKMRNTTKAIKGTCQHNNIFVILSKFHK